MYKILRKEVFSETVKLMVLEAPLVAHKAKAGQFVIVRIDETGERIPLTIADFDCSRRDSHHHLPGSRQIHHANGIAGRRRLL